MQGQFFARDHLVSRFARPRPSIARPQRLGTCRLPSSQPCALHLPEGADLPDAGSFANAVNANNENLWPRYLFDKNTFVFDLGSHCLKEKF